MALVSIYDRAMESSTTTGTGSITTLGAETGGFRTINSVVGTGNQFYYAIQNAASNEWEVGVGTSTGASSFSRDTVLASSNAGSLVNFSSGTKDVFVTNPAAHIQPLTTTGDILYLASNGRSTRLAIGSSGQVLTVSGGLPSWATGTAPPFSDASTLVKNSGDATKLLILSAASVTTGTTRTLTAQDANYTLAGTTVALGGTGAATFTANGVIYGNTASALQVTAAGTNNQVLCGNTSAAPAFRALTYADMPVTTLAVFTPLDNQPPATTYAVLGNRNNHATLEFDNTTNWDAIFTGVLSRSYVGGNVVVAIAWAALSGTSGNVGWQGSFERLNAANHNLDTDAFATAQTSSADACNGTNGKLTVSTITFTSSQIDGVVAGDAFRLRLRRDTSVASNLAARAQVVGVELKG